MLIGGVGALDVDNGGIWTEAGKGVDMAIGVVAGEVAVVEP